MLYFNSSTIKRREAVRLSIILAWMLAFGMLPFVQTLHGQPVLERKVFSSGGGAGASGLQQYTYTFGEPVVGTDMSNLPILTKGFHQPVVQIPLYAQLESFTAVLEDEDAQLDWQFAGFPFPSVFVVERKLGEGFFEDIAILEVDPDAQLVGTYQHRDISVVSATENQAAYRIRMEFPDGAQGLSRTAVVRWESSEDLSLTAYPNPVRDRLHVLFTQAVDGPVEFYLINAIGQRVHTERHEMPAGKVHHRLDMRSLPGGVYVLAVQRSDGLEELMIKVLR